MKNGLSFSINYLSRKNCGIVHYDCHLWIQVSHMEEIMILAVSAQETSEISLLKIIVINNKDIESVNI